MIDNEYAATVSKRDDQLDEVTSIHLTFLEPPNKDSSNQITTKITTSSSTDEVTAL